MWTVTRQLQWPDGNTVVEISGGGRDYTNPGQLVSKYAGEGDEFTDPREAVTTAIAIAKAWRDDEPDAEIEIAHGATGGFTMPFSGEPLTDDVFAELIEWADETAEKLPKCDHCGDLIGKDKYRLSDYPDSVFCREYCAEEYERENTIPTCDECGDEMYKDCNGNMRCEACDDPCPCCSDGGGPQ